jgi:hypothetical protein
LKTMNAQFSKLYFLKSLLAFPRKKLILYSNVSKRALVQSKDQCDPVQNMKI